MKITDWTPLITWHIKWNRKGEMVMLLCSWIFNTCLLGTEDLKL